MAAYVFGPVPSRRLGRSLGVDLVPLKTCTLNCVFCQLGRTTEPCVTPGDFTPVAEVLAQVRARVAESPAPDFVTISGSGEPTLHCRIDEVIAGIKAMASVPVALLTHGTLFWDVSVRRRCLGADIILPSLDAGDEETFRRINRPHPALTLARVVEGLVQLRAEYRGQIWLEVFLIEGVNATEEHCLKIRALAERIGPDRIHLNTAVRPPTESWVRALSRERLEALRAIFGEKAEVIAEFPARPSGPVGAVTPEAVLEILSRRPCTLEDLAAGLGANVAEVSKVLAQLLTAHRVSRTEQDGKAYYRPTGTPPAR